jgi:hypothetical protein
MKKLKLMALESGIKKVLTRDQLKKVVGGISDSGDDEVCVDCGGGHLMCGDGSKCTAIDFDKQLYCFSSNGNLQVYSCPN